MRLKESDMPAEDEWERFFHPKETLRKLGLRAGMTFADLGCGYGTFSIPAAEIVGPKGRVYAVDIDVEMVRRVGQRARRANLSNVKAVVGDVNSSQKSRIPLLPTGTADLVLLANVIHGTREKVGLLRKAAKMARPGGAVAVMNWRVAETPRGPPMRLRPQPNRVVRLAIRAGLTHLTLLDVLPYHYAVLAGRRRANQDSHAR